MGILGQVKNYLITGSSGFLGSRFISDLDNIGASYTQVQRNVDVPASNVIQSSLKTVFSVPAGISDVLHIAGKAHILPRTEEEVQKFFNVNVEGTRVLLKSLEDSRDSLKRFVFISSIAVYGVDRSDKGLSEEDDVNPCTPYGQSKLEAEGLVRDWCIRNDVAYYILRLPLVVGDNPPGNLGEMIHSIQKGWYVSIEGNVARKSAVLARDIVQLVISLENEPSGVFNLTDRTHPSFDKIESAIAERADKSIRWRLPLWLLKVGGRFGDILIKIGIPFPLSSLRLEKLISNLIINDDKAYKELNWRPSSVEEFLKNELDIYV